MLDALLQRLATMSFDDALLKLAIVLVAGIIGGELVARLRLPKVTGWIGTGILLRWLQLPGLDPAAIDGFAPYMNFVLGYIAFTVGAALYFASLRNAGTRLGLLLLGEALITPTFVLAAFFLLGPLLGPIGLRSALVLAAIAIAGAPGTTVLVVGESRAKGILTRTLLAAVALIDMVAVGAFTFASSFLRDDAVELSSWHTAAASVGVEFGLAFLCGASVALLALILNRTIVGPAFLGPVMVAVILGAWGTAVGVGVSGILACTFAGLTLTNVWHDSVRSAEAYLHSIGGVLFAAFFTFAGMKLDFGLVLPMAGLVGLYFAARFFGKYLGAFIAMQLANAPKIVRNNLGLALLPHGGVAVGLILLVQGDPHMKDIEEIVTTIGLSAVAINQLLGPSATRLALSHAGEVGLDRARLLDFLGEQQIIVDLVGQSKEEVVRLLVAQLYATSTLPVSQEEFIAKVLERESRESTCMGDGLMIPHAILDAGDEVKGVLGISSPGLELPTPDDRPVHAVLLLATPQTESKRHLEVLAAFAKAITGDTNLCEQLYHARSPAHAYTILHARDAEDINYFLEDALERAGIRGSLSNTHLVHESAST